MAIKDDNKKTSREDIEKTRNALIKTIRRTVEKSVQEAGFDKTILATVQYCTDATLGQYKIKYQNGYFTAYALDKTVKYSNQASVFVKIQNNDMTKRMHIIGLATDDSDDRKSLLNLEGDQKYGVIGSNFVISEVTAKLKMSSYETSGVEGGSIKYNTKSLYSFDWPANNIINLKTPEVMKQELINAAMTKDDGSVVSYFRLGAEFKTAFDDIQKTSAGNYGLRVRMAFKKEGETNNYFKDFIIDSFSMEGTPFNFPTYTSQYNYWEINPYEFDYITDIYMFTNSFDDMSDPPTGQEPDFDIFLKNINIQPAIKYYTTEDESYQVVINPVGETGTMFSEEMLPQGVEDKLSFSASLTKLGNPIEAKGQNLRFIWGKEDPMVNSVNNKKYNKYLGKGWYCLNTSYRKNYDNETFEELGDPSKYTIINTNKKLGRKTVIEWDYNSNIINIPRAICPGRTSNIKCIIVYEKVAYESTVVPITNPLGSYLLIKDDPKYNYVFRGGFGFDTITAGLFVRSTIDKEIINDRTFEQGIDYHWIITNPDDQKEGGTELPSSDPQNILQKSQDWLDECQDKETNPYNPHDNINIDDEDVIAYYDQIEQDHGFDYKEAMRLSLDRYNYYNQNFSFDNPPTTQQQHQQARIKSRKKKIINGKVAQIYQHYVENFTNDAGYYILGPSSINEGYTETDFTSTNIWYGTSGYDNKPFNTLYKIKGADIQSYLRVRVTATWTHQDSDGDTVVDTIESKEVVLKNDSTVGFDFDLDIINGEQSFVYSNGGLSPTSDDNDQLPMALQPLYFKLYNKNGELIFDSQKEEDVQNGVSINTLNPEWTLFDNQYSLIQNSYAGAAEGHYSKDDDDPRIVHVMKERKLVYDLAEKYDINLRDQSNIDLKITHQGATYYASTNFTFVKQGELGTNGTENYLGITCPNYDEFRESVLNTDERNWFITKIKDVKNKECYPASLRHLTNAFLFGTQAYDTEHNPVHFIGSDTVPYVNLYFAKGQGSKDHTLQGSTFIKLEGRWGDESVQGELVGENTKWSLPLETGKAITGEDKTVNYDCTPSFSLGNTKGASTTLNINYLYENNTQVTPLQAYKPSLIESGSGDNITLKTANNVVAVTSSREVTSIIDPTTQEPISFSNTNYYAIPFFFYSAYDKDTSTNLATGVDPTYYIQICGGFDSITYDGGGLHPSYNKQTPFKLFFYDIDHNDITESVIKKNGVTWECSKGLTLSKNWDAGGNVNAKIYPDEFAEDEQLYGQYCKISNDGGVTYDYFKCIRKHVKGGVKKVKATGQTYQPNEFVEPYWKRVNSISEGKRECYVTPAPTYDTISTQSFYNAWVSVTVRYTSSDNKKDYSGQIVIPINVTCNKYGSDELNNWDGKKLKMGDDYMLAAKVAAGIKGKTNRFTGIYLGKNLYPDEGKGAVGLFGRYEGYRTMFMDAKNGRVFLGPTGSAQIILNPGSLDVDENGQLVRKEKHPWSRLSSWYINNEFLYKPIGEGQSYPTAKQIDGLDENFTLVPPTTDYGSIGMYCPYEDNVDSQDVFLWASSVERDPDIDDVIQEMTTLQTQMAAYGVLFNSDYSPKNDQKRLKHYKDLLKRATHCLDWEQTYGTTVDVSLISEDNEDWDTWQQETGITEKDIKRSAHPSEEEVRTLIDEIYYAIEYYEIHEPKPGGWASTDEPPIVSYVSNYYSTAKTDNRRIVKALTEDIDRYDQYYSTYAALLKSITSGKLVDYRTKNKKDANFYVTYGGHLHCESADVTGKIVAQTGQFGSGLNKILISTVKDGRRYVLYNKNFWVGDDDNDGETEIFMKGEVRAKSGQIGHVGDDVDGEDSRTVFIEYPWYSWRLPAKNEPFNDFTYYLDKLSGKNTTYAIYHKNFSIENSGTVRLNGKIFSREGRIGDWVIDNHELKDCFGNIILHPSDDASLSTSGYIKLGNLTLKGSGAIEGTAWEITAEGVAHFTNAANVFEGNSFKVKDDGGDLTINSQGLDIPTGGQMKIGQEILTAGEHGFNFSGGASFNQEIFTKKISVDPSQTISWGSSASGSGLTLGRNGLSFSGPGVNVQLTAGGLTLGDSILGDSITISSAGTQNLILGTDTKIGGDTLPDYIEKRIKAFLNGCLVLTAYGTGEISGQPVVTYITTKPITTD